MYLCEDWCVPPCFSCSRSTSDTVYTGTVWWHRAVPCASSGCVCGWRFFHRPYRSGGVHLCDLTCGSSGSTALVRSFHRCHTQTLSWCALTISCLPGGPPSPRSSDPLRVCRSELDGCSAAYVEPGGRGVRQHTGTPYCKARRTATVRWEAAHVIFF